MQSRKASRRLRDERGMVLVWVSLCLVTVAGIIVASMGRQQALEGLSEFESASPAHARDVAEAGIVDTLAWFRRQTDQPVAAFTPRRDLTLDPPINETDDPTRGLIRSYEVAPRLWARYEVLIGREAESFTDENGNGRFDAGEEFDDANGNGRRDEALGVRDVTERRGETGNGIVWRIESRGSVFRRIDPTIPLGEGVNARISEARLATEIRRMAINMPASAAICAARGDGVTIGARTRIAGGPGAGIAYASGTGSALLLTGAQVTGSPAHTGIPGLDVDVESVFGTDLAGVRAAAGFVTDDVATLPLPLPSASLTVFEGSLTFNEKRPLRGTAILVVTGDCTIETGSNSFFNGVLWVGGNLTVRAPTLLTGTIVVSGKADLRGLGGDHVEVQQDDEVVHRLLQTLGQYRFAKAIHRVEGEDAPRRLSGEGGGA